MGQPVGDRIGFMGFIPEYPANQVPQWLLVLADHSLSYTRWACIGIGVGVLLRLGNQQYIKEYRSLFIPVWDVLYGYLVHIFILPYPANANFAFSEAK